MLILPAEATHGYQPQRQHGAAARPEAEPEALPDGIIRGRVEALLADGQVRVSAAGRLLQFMPPRPLAPGDFIDLKVTAREPQLILQIAGDAGGQTAELSTAAALIARLAAPGTPRPGVIMAAQPLLPEPPATGPPLAARLEQAITGSGLFYESHQAEWVAGRRSQAALAAEPQGRLQPSRPAPVQPALTDDEHAALAAAAGPQTTARLLHTAPEALPQVRNQLDALDSRRLHWVGELWPGQTASWEIDAESDEPRQGSGNTGDAAPGWQSRLSFVLPQLGAVSVQLDARGSSTAIRIQAASPASAAAMAEDSARLRTALLAAGVTLRDLVVEAAPPAAETPP